MVKRQKLAWEEDSVTTQDVNYWDQIAKMTDPMFKDLRTTEKPESALLQAFSDGNLSALLPLKGTQIRSLTMQAYGRELVAWQEKKSKFDAFRAAEAAAKAAAAAAGPSSAGLTKMQESINGLTTRTGSIFKTLQNVENSTKNVENSTKNLRFGTEGLAEIEETLRRVVKEEMAEYIPDVTEQVDGLQHAEMQRLAVELGRVGQSLESAMPAAEQGTWSAAAKQQVTQAVTATTGTIASFLDVYNKVWDSRSRTYQASFTIKAVDVTPVPAVPSVPPVTAVTSVTAVNTVPPVPTRFPPPGRNPGTDGRADSPTLDTVPGTQQVDDGWVIGIRDSEEDDGDNCEEENGHDSEDSEAGEEEDDLGGDLHEYVPGTQPTVQTNKDNRAARILRRNAYNQIPATQSYLD